MTSPLEQPVPTSDETCKKRYGEKPNVPGNFHSRKMESVETDAG